MKSVYQSRHRTWEMLGIVRVQVIAQELGKISLRVIQDTQNIRTPRQGSMIWLLNERA